jgi:hypothetical protein
MYAVYRTTTGALISVGSIVADPLPAGLTALDLGNDDRLITGYGYWDPVTKTVKAVVPSPVDIAANDRTLRDKAATGLTTNTTYLALGSPTNAQNLAQIRALTRQMNGVIRLTLGTLDDVSGT